MKKVFVCGFEQESNSFNPVLTDEDCFRAFGIFEGGGMPEEKVCIPHARSMINCLKGAGVEIECGVVMRACSGGPVDQRVVDKFLEKTLSQLKAAKPVDGVAVALHGATISDKCEDVCGYILEAIRNEAGENIPISASFDLHANITEKIMINADYISGFQTYPHIDQTETGARAAKRLLDAMSGEGAKTVRVTIPMMAPPGAYTTGDGALNVLVNRAKKMISDGEILDYTLFEVQPWLDVKEIATSIIVIAQNEEKAKKAAKVLAYDNFNIRRELQGKKLMSIYEVVEKAVKNKSGKPVVLVDSADSPNAGATADCAAVIGHLLPYRDRLKCAVAVSDIPAVQKAFSMGVNAVGDFTLGGTKAGDLSKPVTVKNAKVMGLYDGNFFMYGPQEKGAMRDLGKTAILAADKITIHVSSNGVAEGDLNFYRSFGIDPAQYDLVCVKACTSFRAGYEPVAAEICNTDTPGSANSCLAELPFTKLPEIMYPFTEISAENISEPKRYR